MYTGVYKGRDQRDLVDEAIQWWENQLDEMETLATAKILEGKS